MIRVNDKLVRALGTFNAATRPIRIISGDNVHLRFSMIEGVPFRNIEELGYMADVTLKGRSIGIAGGRPIIAIFDSHDQKNFIGYCFRNCRRVQIYDIYGGEPKLNSLYEQPASGSVPLKQFSDARACSVIGEIEPIPFSRIYNLLLARQEISSRLDLVGMLEHPARIGADEEIALYPVWHLPLRLQLSSKIEAKNLNLKAVVYYQDGMKRNLDFFKMAF
jgi:hypothetical protein